MVERRGPELTEQAIEAWMLRLEGTHLLDVAKRMRVSLDSARALLHEAHECLKEDLKSALEQNRSLDLARLDALLQTYYPQAKSGDLDAAAYTLKLLAHRSKLTGTEPLQTAGNTNSPQNILVWVQSKLPSIQQLVDSMPTE
jgi:hypothetical protein